MRDVIAGLIAIVLLLVAISLAAALHTHRQRRARARDAERVLGRRIITELPVEPELLLFSEDDTRFYYGVRGIDKDLIRAVWVLVNGVPIGGYSSSRSSAPEPARQISADLAAEGILRDRWDVAIETASETILVECGAIRDRVSQELAQRIFDAVKGEVEKRDWGFGIGD